MSWSKSILPGDTIWLRGGTYHGHFDSWLQGTASAPIKVRQYPGERAIIDCAGSTDHWAISVHDVYTWFWGFEITNSDTNRTNPLPGGGYPGTRNLGISVGASGTKIINMVIHDTGQGMFVGGAFDAEIYGNLIYYNGWTGPDRGHGHSIYVQNVLPATKTIKDNIAFAQFDIGFHAYSSGAGLDNIRAEGNTEFIEGILSGYYTYNMLYGGLAVANTPQLVSNNTYTPVALGGNNLLGYVNGGCTNATVTGNYFVGSTAFKLVNCTSGLSMTGNTFYGAINAFTSGQYPSNTYFSARPTGVRVFVRPNQYEAGRANITVYNWDLVSSVNVDLSSVLPVGSTYEIRNAQNYFGTPVLTGTYGGGTVSLPMAGLSVETPVGVAAPAATGPEFNAFVLLPSGIGRTAPAAPKSVRPKARTLDRRS